MDDCLLKPCLHTTSAQRFANGCPQRQLWNGSWSISPAWKARPDFVLQQQFIPNEDCDVGQLFSLSGMQSYRGPHVTVAREEHTLLRLNGLRGELWLMLGTSLEHAGFSNICKAFEQERKVENWHNGPVTATEMRIHWCRVPPLNFTVAYTYYGGIATWTHVGPHAANKTGFTRPHASVLRDRYKTLGGWLERRGLGQPKFLTFGGTEWDFQRWFYQRAANPWLEEVPSLLRMHEQALRNRWPNACLTLRTMFRSHYYGFSNATSAMYKVYNGAMRSLARASQASSQCPPTLALELPALVNYSDDSGLCQGRSCAHSGGWTVDGLHPQLWAMVQFATLSVNALVDCHACAASIT